MNRVLALVCEYTWTISSRTFWLLKKHNNHLLHFVMICLLEWEKFISGWLKVIQAAIYQMSAYYMPGALFWNWLYSDESHKI